MVSSSQILPEWCKSGPRGAAALPADSPIVSRGQQKDNVEIVGQNQRPAFGWSSRFGDHTEVLLPVAYLGFSMLRATMSYLIFCLDTCYRKCGFSTSIQNVDLNSAIFIHFPQFEWGPLHGRCVHLLSLLPMVAVIGDLKYPLLGWPAAVLSQLVGRLTSWIMGLHRISCDWQAPLGPAFIFICGQVALQGL